MGIYIEGMKMPTGYVELGIALDADGHPTAVTRDGEIFDVIPVPPHGRLIDADAPISLIDTRGQKFEVTVAHIIEKNLGAVKAIIPASEEG